MQLAVDLLNPLESTERRRHKLKRLVQSPNSYFMDVKCPGMFIFKFAILLLRLIHMFRNSFPRFLGCFNITTVFSHAQTVVLCASCATVLCQPTGGKARLTGTYRHISCFRSPLLTTLMPLFIFSRGLLFQEEVRVNCNTSTSSHE